VSAFDTTLREPAEKYRNCHRGSSEKATEPDEHLHRDEPPALIAVLIEDLDALVPAIGDIQAVL